MGEPITFRRMAAEDFLSLDRQPSQRVCMYGEEPTLDAARQYADQAEAWVAVDGGGRLLACLGVAELFVGRCGIAWALLGTLIGHHHLAISRFGRDIIRRSPFDRIEALARARDVEPMIAALPDADRATVLEYAMGAPTPECRWPLLLGMEAAHVVRKFGASGETYVLFERVR